MTQSNPLFARVFKIIKSDEKLTQTLKERDREDDKNFREYAHKKIIKEGYIALAQ